MGMYGETCEDFSNGSPRFNSFKKTEDYNRRQSDSALDVGDDMNDRVYTVDSIHTGVPNNSFSASKSGVDVGQKFINTPRGSLNQTEVVDTDIKKLYLRLQALEADRESMRQTMLSMRTNKAQLLLLKEIAQHLCKDVSPERQITLKKRSLLGSLSFSLCKWIAPFVFWKRKGCRSNYFGLSANSAGLLMLLHKGPRLRQWRILRSTQL